MLNVAMKLCLLACAFVGAHAHGAARAEEARYATSARDVSDLLAILAERLSLMEDVAKAKWQSQLPIHDPEREAALLAKTSGQAHRAGLSPESVRAFLALQMELARAIQSRHFERWSRAGYVAQGARDLRREIRPVLDALSERLLPALARALPELTREDFRARHAAEAQKVLRGAGLTQDEVERMLGALAALRAAPESLLRRIRASGVLRVGTTGDYAPFSSEQNEVLSGVDITLAEAFAHALGVEVHFVRTSWPELLADYRSNAFELAASGISRTPERAAQATLSRGYHRGGKTAIARCKDQKRFDTLTEIDRPEVRVVVNPGGTNERFARETLHAAQLRVFDDNQRIFDEIVEGRADVMFTDDVEVALQRRLRPSLCRATQKLWRPADKVWLLARDRAFRAEVDAFLEERLNDGSVARLLRRALAPPPKPTRD